MNKNRTQNPISLVPLYPHFKITREDFPRLYVTRRIKNVKDEYFGAFLPATNARIWLYHLHRIFRLRSCQIEIDGNFPQPCQQFFTKKCVAPCVKEICSQPEYAENVEALRLFLSGDEKGFEKLVVGKIDGYSESLEYEKAARWRDVWRETRDLENDAKHAVSLKNAVDTYSFEETATEIIIRLLTTRGRKFLGDREFVFAKTKEISLAQMLEKVLRNFYRYSAPREIRLPLDFSGRKDFALDLQMKFGAKTVISIIKNELNTTALMRIKRTKLSSELDKIGGKMNAGEISAELKKIFGLKRKPHSIEAFDVAHLANIDFITANSVWNAGEIRREKTLYWKIDAASELEAMAQGVKMRLENGDAPDLILIDGGRGQLNAVLREVGADYAGKTEFISAVKPPGKHADVSHFLTSDGRRIEFIAGEQIFELLRNLRDESHRTANELHRQYRDNKYIFAADQNQADEIPLVIIRFDEPGGAAEDLQPIKTNLTSNK